ncbi:nitrate reductase molybdenum cofactor assembly chaperone [Aliiglaciecola sp. CAU 1673]|uniref:nitrate reductase molybdenum cofactor assembly chaperone n=1 Tax=Aliiglaciecola sp. CAU 1673 TaxID=3032595 RepID=UPI0023DC983F|nr:nitrate reductase molybdenum cofactor assembly chaperone [Aliiglaciecola sp. CAU 1673]MDF2177410.1 nitrate reductase molybdenum cofactor assembly chaperone [Aliiglaciecola sp. CAU 1673]
MQIISLIARLLDYPRDELMENGEVILALIKDAPLPDAEGQALLAFAQKRLSGELLDWQEEYDGLFERGRSLSLLIYEHIHGESRDRGQAMVELQRQYQAAGLAIAAHELPDYLPLFLEFAATQGNEASGWLRDIAPVLGLLAVRLDKRQSNYGALFHALLALSQAELDLGELAQQVATEKADNTPKALDKVWEEEAVIFGGDAINGGCPSAANRPSEGQRRDQDLPIEFIDAASRPQAAIRSL